MATEQGSRWDLMRYLLNLFCCPPLPSRIASKLAFLPPELSYSFIEKESTLGAGNVVSPSPSPDALTSRLSIVFHDESLWPAEQLRRVNPSATGCGRSRNSQSSTGTGRTCRCSCCASCGAPARTQSEPNVSTTGVASSGPGGTCRCSCQTEHLRNRGDENISSPAQLPPSIDRVIEPFFVTNKYGTKIACIYIRPFDHSTDSPSTPLASSHQDDNSGPSNFTILFSHGNAVDIGHMSHFLYTLSHELHCNIIAYDYSGYGLSDGRPSERNILADIEATWKALMSRYGLTPTNIILYGQSIGTVPTVDLASRYECAGVVLHSPLLSGLKVACPTMKRTWFFDAFKNIEKVDKIVARVLVIHGQEDDVIDISHGMQIHAACPNTADPLWVEGAGHNDIEFNTDYLNRLMEFLAELKSRSDSGGNISSLPTNAGQIEDSNLVAGGVASSSSGQSPGSESCRPINLKSPDDLIVERAGAAASAITATCNRCAELISECSCFVEDQDEDGDLTVQLVDNGTTPADADGDGSARRRNLTKSPSEDG